MNPSVEHSASLIDIKFRDQYGCTWNYLDAIVIALCDMSIELELGVLLEAI